MPGAGDTAEFKVNLDTGALKGNAQSAAEHLEQLQKQIDKDTTALGQMQKAMKQLQQGTSVDIATFKSLTARIDAQKQKIAGLRSDYINLGGTFGKIAQPAKKPVEAIRSLTEAAQAAGGPLGRTVGQLSSLGRLAAAGPVLLVAAAFVALAAAVSLAYAALVKYGLAQADARRDEALRLEGLTKMRFMWQQLYGGQRRAAESVGFLQSELDRVSDKVALGRGEVEKYQAQLYKLGLRGGNLQHALEGVAIAASTVGDSQAQMYLQLMMGAGQTGASVKKVADDIRARLGPLAEKQLLSWGVQSKKLRENLTRLFTGVGIENFLRPVKAIADLFSATSVTGKALHDTVSRLFKPLEAVMPVVAHLAKRFVQGLLIGFLTAENAILRFAIALVRSTGPALNLVAKQLNKVDTKKAILAFEALGGVIAAISIAALIGIGAGLSSIAINAALAAKALTLLGVAAKQSFLFLSGQGPVWEKIGESVPAGIVKGLKKGWSQITGALRSGAQEMVATFTSALQIRSPSRIFFAKTAEVPNASVLAVRAGVPRLRVAMRELADVPRKTQMTRMPVEAPRLAPAGQPTRAGARTIRIDNLNVTASSADPQDLAQAVRDELLHQLEGVAIEMGAA